MIGKLVSSIYLKRSKWESITLVLRRVHFVRPCGGLQGNLIRILPPSPNGGFAEVPALNVATGIYIGTLLADGLKYMT